MGRKCGRVSRCLDIVKVLEEEVTVTSAFSTLISWFSKSVCVNVEINGNQFTDLSFSDILFPQPVICSIIRKHFTANHPKYLDCFACFTQRFYCDIQDWYQAWTAARLLKQTVLRWQRKL